jgi:hypothetical protein
LVFKEKIGRIRDIKVESRTGKIYLLTDEGSLWLLENKAVKLIGDVNGDGTIGVSDILAVIDSWGVCDGCAADINQEGIVDTNDILLVLSAWGPCP